MNIDTSVQIIGIRAALAAQMQRTRKTHPASPKQLDYLCDLAEKEGMDAEALASIGYNKDVADLTEDEAGALIAAIHGG